MACFLVSSAAKPAMNCTEVVVYKSKCVHHLAAYYIETAAHILKRDCLAHCHVVMRIMQPFWLRVHSAGLRTAIWECWEE